MRKYTINIVSALCAILATFSTTSCGGNSTTTSENDSINLLEKPESQDDILYKLNAYQVSDTVRMNGHKYTYSIERIPLDSIIITDADGNRSRDNSIRLSVQRDGVTFFERTFTRAAFHIRIDEKYYQQCILLGMNFDRVTDYGLRFQASIGNGADSEDYKPYSVTIGTDGSTDITELDLYDDGDVSRFEDEGV